MGVLSNSTSNIDASIYIGKRADPRYDEIFVEYSKKFMTIGPEDGNKYRHLYISAPMLSTVCDLGIPQIYTKSHCASLIELKEINEFTNDSRIGIRSDNQIRVHFNDINTERYIKNLDFYCKDFYIKGTLKPRSTFWFKNITIKSNMVWFNIEGIMPKFDKNTIITTNCISLGGVKHEDIYNYLSDSMLPYSKTMNPYDLIPIEVDFSMFKHWSQLFTNPNINFHVIVLWYYVMINSEIDHMFFIEKPYLDRRFSYNHITLIKNIADNKEYFITTFKNETNFHKCADYYRYYKNYDRYLKGLYKNCVL